MHYDINISIALDSWPWCVYLYLYDARVYDSYIHDLCIHESWHDASTYHAYIFWPPGYKHLWCTYSYDPDPWPMYVLMCPLILMHYAHMWCDLWCIYLLTTWMHAWYKHVWKTNPWYWSWPWYMHVCMMHTYPWCSRLFTNRAMNKAILGVGCQHKKCPRHDDQCHLICWSCHWGGQMNMCISPAHPTHHSI